MLVAVLLLSDLPSVSAASPSRPTPPTATGGRESTLLNSSASDNISRPSSTNPALCFLGIQPECPAAEQRAGGALPTSPVPDAPVTSSWTNITPPTGTPNAFPLEWPATVYYPSGHDVILFGGLGQASAGQPDTYLRNTWSFVANKWTELYTNTTCTATTCPPARAGAMIAYYPAQNALLLFGGYIYIPGMLVGRTIAYNDTWLFSGGVWTNITASAGAPPSARFGGVMSYDPSDNYVVLFGGETASGNALGDTWKFASGTWTNISAGEKTPPEARAGAAIAVSPDGHVMIFGGADSYDNGVDYAIIQNSCNNGTTSYEFGSSAVAWWFFHGQWSAMGGYGNTGQGLCAPHSPAGSSASAPSPLAPFSCTSVCANPPCGRIYPALGWSPKNARFVLYGGYGTYIEGVVGCSCGASLLNDTFTYGLPSGGGFLWYNATDAGDPSARYAMGYASDLTDDYFEIFGGNTQIQLLNSTYRFYELVHAGLSGPLSYDTGGLQFQTPFVATGYGGTGNLQWTFTTQKVRNQNSLTGNAACSFLRGSTGKFAYNGTFNENCIPSPKAFNVFRITLTVTDEGNASHPFATANWSFTVIPPETMRVYSEYVTDFYSNVDLTNNFTVFAEVAGEAPKAVNGTLGGSALPPFSKSSNPKYWVTSVDMAGYQPGAILYATAQFGNWTLNATYDVTMISTPSWLLTLFQATGASQSIVSHGKGPYNKTFTIDEKYSWSLSDALGFSIPVSLVGGSYGLIPSVDVVFAATSTGNLSVTGTFSLKTPSITIGPASLKITASLSLSGTFEVVGSGVQWGSASAKIKVSATLSASIPIYGFSLFGMNVGFTLQLSITPSITLDMILAPLAPGGQSIISNVDIEIQKFLGSFSLALSAAIDFGIGIASIGLGVGLSVAVAFQLDPFGISAGWVNGSIFVTATFLWWSDSFNIVGPANIFSWGSANPARVADDVAPAGSYNNGTHTKWVVQVEYYATSGYDSRVWNAANSSGPAVSDIYPYTEVSAAAGYNGAYFFYTDNNASLPVTDGLLISGGRLNSTSNAFEGVPGPSDPADYEIASPQATTLPDGDLYVLWTALPTSEANVNSPLNLTSMALQGALFHPNNDTWGPVRTFSSGGFAESYQADALGDSGYVAELVSSTPLLQNTGPERLVEYNLTTGAVVANLSTQGLSEVVSLRGAAGLALVETIGGNYSLISLATGDSVAIAYTPPSDYELVSANFVQGSPSALVLLYRGPLLSELVLYDTAGSQTLANLTLGVDAFEAEAIASGSTDYVFVRTSLGIDAWKESVGTFTNLSGIRQSGIQSYGLVQAANSILVYSLATTGGNTSDPIKSLMFTEIGASLPAVATPAIVRNRGATGTTSGSGPSPDWLLYLGIAVAAAAVLLAVVAVVTRRRPPRSATIPSTPPEGASPEPPVDPPPPTSPPG